MGKPSEKIRAIVTFPSGSVFLDVPFWQPDASVIREAIEALPGFLAPNPEDCKVERPRP